MFRIAARNVVGTLTLALSAGAGLAADNVSAQLEKAGFVVIATTTVKQGAKDKFIEIMRAHVAATRKEPGVLLFEAFGGKSDCAGIPPGIPSSACDPLTFVNVELYKNLAAFEAHMKDPRVVKVLEAFKPLVANSDVKIVNHVP